LSYSIPVNVDSHHQSPVTALGHHQRDQPCACPYVEHSWPAVFCRKSRKSSPRAQQRTIGTYFHGAAFLAYPELFELKEAVAHLPAKLIIFSETASPSEQFF
jgi:hypothetical protein